MKTMTLLIVLLTASLTVSITQTGRATDEYSVYLGLVELQTVDQITARKAIEESPYRLELRDQQSIRNSERSYRLYGWLKTGTYESLATETDTKIESTGGSTITPSTASRSSEEALRVAPYIGPELKPNELPYIDKDGNKDRNYGILLTAKWCRWCNRMYRDTVKPLREEGFKIYILDIDEFPDIKERIYRLDKSAEMMKKGVPFFIIRDGGKTTKIFFGYTKTEKIRPYLKNYQKQIDEELNYDFR